MCSVIRLSNLRVLILASCIVVFDFVEQAPMQSVNPSLEQVVSPWILDLVPQS